MKKELRGFVFYAQDYFGDSAVRLMPTNLRMVWVEAFLLMSQSPRRGVLLKKNGEPYSVTDIAKIVNTSVEEVEQAFAWVIREGIASTDRATKTLMNRRMVRDENRSKINRKNGKKGGNPLLLDDTEDKDLLNSVNQTDKAKPEPDPDPLCIIPPLQDSPNLENGSLLKSGPPEKTADRPRDLASDMFAAKCREATQVPYAPEGGDFVMLAKLRKAFQIPARQLPPGWEQACENYFASPLGQYSLADLANPKRFAVFRNSPLDEYNKPTVKRSNGKESHAQRVSRTNRETAELFNRQLSQPDGHGPGTGSPVGSGTALLPRTERSD